MSKIEITETKQYKEFIQAVRISKVKNCTLCKKPYCVKVTFQNGKTMIIGTGVYRYLRFKGLIPEWTR